MEVVVYCDRIDCRFNCDEECQRTSIKIQADVSYSGAYCVSVEKKEAPASLPADQEQK